MESLVKLAEELLFTFPLPENIVKKYENLRNKVFGELNIEPSTSIWKLQREAYAKSFASKKDFNVQTNLYPEIEKIFRLKITENEQKIEAVKWETIQSFQKNSQIIEEYQNLCRFMLIFIDQIAYSHRSLSSQEVYKDYGVEDYSFSLNLHTDYENILNDFKILQNSQYSQLNQLKKIFESKKNDFSNFFDNINSELNKKAKKIRELENKSAEDYEKYQIETIGYDNKLKNLEESFLEQSNLIKNQLENEINELHIEYNKKQELLIKNHSNETQSILIEKEKINKKFLKSLEDHEKSQENSLNIINSLKIHIQDLSSEKISLINQSESFQNMIEDLKSQLEASEGDNKTKAAQIDSLESENYKIKLYLKNKEDQHQYEYESIESSYKKILEKVSFANQDSIQQYEQQIIQLENTLEEKNALISTLYEKTEQISIENNNFIEIINKKDEDTIEIIDRYNQISQDYKLVIEDLEKYKKNTQEIQEISKKYYFEIKSKPKSNCNDYFKELILCIPDLITDKEWLITKIAELTKTSQAGALDSKSSTSKSVFNINSLKALKQFENSRKDILNRLNHR